MAGAVGVSTVLAPAPSTGSPSSLSAYGTIVLGTTITPNGSPSANVYIFSTVGPFYVQKLNLQALNNGTTATSPIDLSAISYDTFMTFNAQCAVIIPSISPPGSQAADIISVAPSTLTDPTGARAIPAANGVQFTLSYDCGSAVFPESLTLYFEATILAPTSATVSMCANPGSVPLSSCPITSKT